MSHSHLKLAILSVPLPNPQGHQLQNATKLYMQALLYQFVSRLLSVPLVFQYKFSLLEPELSFLKL